MGILACVAWAFLPVRRGEHGQECPCYGQPARNAGLFMRRHLIGIIALVFLVSFLGIWLWMPVASDNREPLMGAFGRVGILLGLFWVAYRDLQRIPVWLLAAVPALLVVLAIRPKWFLFLLPVVLALAFLFPRIKKRLPR